MSQGYARFIGRFKYIIIVIWAILVAAALLWLPKLETVVSHQSTTFLPNSSKTVVAGNLLNKIDPKHHANSTVIVSVHNPHGLTNKDVQYFQQKLNQIDAAHRKYGVTYLQDKGNVSKSIKAAFTSKDNTTEIATIGLTGDITNPHMPQTISTLRQVFQGGPSDATYSFTGDLPIQEDEITISQHGAAKTAIVTIVLVLTILILVFRSIVTPFVTLLSIGLSYLVSSGVVALLAEHGLPVSTFTQTFLIATLFGAGTDYSIILLNRFREELTKDHGHRVEALAGALSGVGKTVVFSSLTVFISFAVLYFANFGLYRSAVGVAVGILITLVTCLTLVPALMATLGTWLYWPRRPKPGVPHKPSRVWSFTSGVAVRRPWWTLLGLVVVLGPVALLFSNLRTFDPMLDIPSASSVVGFHNVASAFGVGRVMPVNIVLKTKANLRTPQGLATIDNITKNLAGVATVKEVDSVTRPLGKEVKNFQLAYQNKQAATGLGKVESGMNTLAGKLGQGGKSADKTPQGVDQLASGSGKVTSGAKQIASATSSLATGTEQLNQGATKLQTGLNKLASSSKTFASSLSQTASGMNKVTSGLGQTAKGAGKLATSANQISIADKQMAQAASSLANALAAWSKAHPSDASNPSWQQILQIATQLQAGTTQTAQGSGQLAQGMSQLSNGMPSLTQGATQINQALGKLSSGAAALNGGIASTASGSAGLVTGSGKLATGAKKTSAGAQSLANGSEQVTQGITKLGNALGPLASGFSGAESGVQKLSSGVSSVKSFLQKSSTASTAGNPGFYIPASELSKNKQLKQMMDAYISPDGHIAKFTVILTTNPYSHSSMNTVPKLEQAAEAALASSPVNSGTVYGTGTSATQAELNALSSQDFIHTMVLIFAAIFILLALMLRSLLAPLYLLISLAGTYFVTMGLLQTIALHVLHQPGISWSAPFFIFLLLVALGVDYSIFLMARFEEEYVDGVSPKAAIRHAMSAMGGVVFAAAAIMAGTFGSMTVTGMTTMVEIGLAIVMGLFLYAVILLAFFIPACAAIIGRAHGWPFARTVEEEDGPRRTFAPTGNPSES